MMRRATFVSAVFVLAAGNVSAEQIPPGTWLQTSSSAGDCADCEITIATATPQIIRMSSNNGWTGYAHYSAADDAYKGAFQWNADAGGAYDNVVFLVELTYEGKTLSFKANSEPLSFSSTYRRK